MATGTGGGWCLNNCHFVTALRLSTMHPSIHPNGHSSVDNRGINHWSGRKPIDHRSRHRRRCCDRSGWANKTDSTQFSVFKFYFYQHHDNGKDQSSHITCSNYDRARGSKCSTSFGFDNCSSMSLVHAHRARLDCPPPRRFGNIVQLWWWISPGWMTRYSLSELMNSCPFPMLWFTSKECDTFSVSKWAGNALRNVQFKFTRSLFFQIELLASKFRKNIVPNGSGSIQIGNSQVQRWVMVMMVFVLNNRVHRTSTTRVP